MRLQSLLFKKKYWRLPSAKYWIKKHGYLPLKLDITKNFYRFRLLEPIRFSTYRIIEFGDNIKAVVAFD